MTLDHSYGIFGLVYLCATYLDQIMPFLYLQIKDLILFVGLLKANA